MPPPEPSVETRTDDDHDDPRELLTLATRVAEQAATLLLEGARHHRSSVGTKSSPTDMVTEMDRASEQLIVSELLAARPDDGILGEEGSSRPGRSGLRWVIDPLDGTTNYLYGHPPWAVSIAVEHTPSAQVLAGVVLDAFHGETFVASRGDGARRNGEPIRCSTQTDLAQALVATGFGYQPVRRRGQAEVLVGLLPEVRDIRRMGAAAVDLCSVACGRVDAYYEYLSWWDCAAGQLVAREAGAVVTSLDGRPLADAGSVIAAAPGIATSLSAKLGALGAHQVP